MKKTLHFRGPKFWKKCIHIADIQTKLLQILSFLYMFLGFQKSTEMDSCKLIQIDSECKNVWVVQFVMKAPSTGRFQQKMPASGIPSKSCPWNFPASSINMAHSIKKESNPLICPLKKIQDEQAALVTFHTFS